MALGVLNGAWTLRDSLDDHEDPDDIVNDDSDSPEPDGSLDEVDDDLSDDDDDDDSGCSEGDDSWDDPPSMSFADDGWLVFEEDESACQQNAPPPPPQLPFWFSFEDRDQIREIVRCYDETLGLPEERRKQIRQPSLFVGRVERRVVAARECLFTTLDTVELFRRVAVPPGAPLPGRVRVCQLLTEWCDEEGVPKKQTVLKSGTAVADAWQSLVVQCMQPSYLLCLPVYGTRTEFDYHVSPQPMDVGYSPKSPALCKHRHWFPLPSGVAPHRLSFGE